MNIKSNKGLSLVEVIATVAIMAIIIIPISLVFTTSYSNFNIESDKAAAQKAAREVLYGKGFSSYGVMGDLERSNAGSDKITIGDIIDASVNSISILDDAGVKKIYYYNQATQELKYKNELTDENYFLNETSTNGRAIIVKKFDVKKITRGTTIDSVILDTDIIRVTVTVECGRSGNITLESSYRIPNIEK